MKKLHQLTLAAITITSPSLAYTAEWSNLNIQYLYSSRYKEPFNNERIAKQTVTIEYANAYSLGSNYAYIDIARSEKEEIGAISGQKEGPTDFFGEWYHTLSLSKVLKRPMQVGWIRDVGWLAGISAGSKTSEFRPDTRAWVTGIEFTLPSPAGGYQNISFSGYFDDSRNAFGEVQSRDTYRIAHCFLIPFTFGGIEGKLEGYWKAIGPAFEGSKTQFLTQPRLLLDISRFVGAAPRSLYGGIEYQYYRNKYGTTTDESHPQLMLQLNL
ncbi:hypothetical protein [Methyloversatilis discipulorum]|uniref:hypothetical protein n=1 Tax=Methyloversatilis discipulorum TaxID=1119528 RepID=UPI0012FB8DC4|nr:hypothetical protein [Methyloversatilis discipulorum]